MKKLAFLITLFVSFLAADSKAYAAANVNFTSPSGTTLTPNSASSVNVNLNVGGDPTLGFTFRIDVTGTVPSDIVLNPATINTSGNALELITNPPIVSDITGGKRFTIAMVSPVSDADGYTNNSPTQMAFFSFTAPSSGSMIFSLVNTSEVTHATSYANLLTSFPTTTLNVASTPTATPTQPAPTATPTSVPPTATPIPPSPTTSPLYSGVMLKFRLQGITSQVTTQKIDFEVKGPGAGSSILNCELGSCTFPDVSITPDANGIFEHTLNGLPAQQVKICVKGDSHLKRCFDNVTVQPNIDITLDKTTSSNDALLIGDVTADNAITSADIGAILASYNGFKVDVSTLPSAQQNRDINFDGFITIEDVALATMNYSNFRLDGDE